jgi:uncharacterized protein (DUF1697 family)
VTGRRGRRRAWPYNVPVIFIALIRGINVGGKKKLRMEDLKGVCESLGLADVKTILQSGNVVFRTGRSDRKRLTDDLEKGILEAAGIEATVILRTDAELQQAVERNPFRAEAERDPGRLVIVFLDGKPTIEAAGDLKSYRGPETMHLIGQELFIYYSQGQGTSKLTNALIERKLGVSATARNWNTVCRLLDVS